MSQGTGITISQEFRTDKRAQHNSYENQAINTLQSKTITSNFFPNKGGSPFNQKSQNIHEALRLEAKGYGANAKSQNQQKRVPRILNFNKQIQSFQFQKVNQEQVLSESYQNKLTSDDIIQGTQVSNSKRMESNLKSTSSQRTKQMIQLNLKNQLIQQVGSQDLEVLRIEMPGDQGSDSREAESKKLFNEVASIIDSSAMRTGQFERMEQKYGFKINTQINENIMHDSELESTIRKLTMNQTQKDTKSPSVKSQSSKIDEFQLITVAHLNDPNNIETSFDDSQDHYKIQAKPSLSKIEMRNINQLNVQIGVNQRRIKQPSSRNPQQIAYKTTSINPFEDSSKIRTGSQQKIQDQLRNYPALLLNNNGRAVMPSQSLKNIPTFRKDFDQGFDYTQHMEQQSPKVVFDKPTFMQLSNASEKMRNALSKINSYGYSLPQIKQGQNRMNETQNTTFIYRTQTTKDDQKPKNVNLRRNEKIIGDLYNQIGSLKDLKKTVSQQELTLAQGQNPFIFQSNQEFTEYFLGKEKPISKSSAVNKYQVDYQKQEQKKKYDPLKIIHSIQDAAIANLMTQLDPKNDQLEIIINKQLQSKQFSSIFGQEAALKMQMNNDMLAQDYRMLVKYIGADIQLGFSQTFDVATKIETGLRDIFAKQRLGDFIFLENQKYENEVFDAINPHLVLVIDSVRYLMQQCSFKNDLVQILKDQKKGDQEITNQENLINKQVVKRIEQINRNLESDIKILLEGGRDFFKIRDLVGSLNRNLNELENSAVESNKGAIIVREVTKHLQHMSFEPVKKKKKNPNRKESAKETTGKASKEVKEMKKALQQVAGARPKSSEIKDKKGNKKTVKVQQDDASSSISIDQANKGSPNYVQDPLLTTVREENNFSDARKLQIYEKCKEFMTPEELKLLKIRYLNEQASHRESVSKIGREDVKSLKSMKSHKIDSQIPTKQHSIIKPHAVSPLTKIERNFDSIIEYKKPGIIQHIIEDQSYSKQNTDQIESDVDNNVFLSLQSKSLSPKRSPTKLAVKDISPSKIQLTDLGIQKFLDTTFLEMATTETKNQRRAYQINFVDHLTKILKVKYGFPKIASFCLDQIKIRIQEITQGRISNLMDQNFARLVYQLLQDSNQSIDYSLEFQNQQKTIIFTKLLYEEATAKMRARGIIAGYSQNKINFWVGQKVTALDLIELISNEQPISRLTLKIIESLGLIMSDLDNLEARELHFAKMKLSYKLSLIDYDKNQFIKTLGFDLENGQILKVNFFEIFKRFAQNFKIYFSVNEQLAIRNFLFPQNQDESVQESRSRNLTLLQTSDSGQPNHIFLDSLSYNQIQFNENLKEFFISFPDLVQLVLVTEQANLNQLKWLAEEHFMDSDQLLKNNGFNQSQFANMWTRVLRFSGKIFQNYSQQSFPNRWGSLKQKMISQQTGISDQPSNELMSGLQWEQLVQEFEKDELLIKNKFIGIEAIKKIIEEISLESVALLNFTKLRLNN